MLVKFDSEAGQILMFGDVAVALLKLMGQSGTVPGAILAPDIPAAVERLQSNVDSAVTRNNLAKSQQEAAEQIFVRYVTMGRGEGASPIGPSSGAESRVGTAVSGSIPATINLPENLISKLVEMRSLEADLAYRQKLNDEVVKCSAETIKT
ncbi:MAG: DUF1840 family protein, partial [Betaproteobacteria bacterium]|nr:DUF1840 family protein [Betaproteobacteria bacterium]